ncbi:winged helix-turn-helix domain-containing protein [Paeniroseomonas aquatica]|uniref:helix-turn-helix domain-containing protein n=1 Tax=Paeniroseomonas aquatica TaxID=373043 RepID=UPI00362251D0
MQNPGIIIDLDGVRRLIDLCQWLWEEYRVTVAKQTLSREVRALGYRKLSARPRHHAQAAGAVDLYGMARPSSRLRYAGRVT